MARCSGLLSALRLGPNRASEIRVSGCQLLDGVDPATLWVVLGYVEDYPMPKGSPGYSSVTGNPSRRSNSLRLQTANKHPAPKVKTLI